jgi:hypothetical protein
MTHDDFPGIGRQGLGDELEEGGFAGAVGADDAHTFSPFKLIGKIFDDLFVAVAFAHVVALHDFAAQPVFLDLERQFVFLLFQRVVFFFPAEIRIYPGFGFGGSGLGTAPHPVEFAFEQFVLALVGGGLYFFPQGLFLQVIGVVAGITAELAAVEFNDAVAHVFEEIPVVGHHKQGESGLLEVFF